MSSLEKTVDFLCLRYESTSASSVPESVTKDLELLQDRYINGKFLRDILEAQKQRISSLGINIENYLESPTVPPPSREPQQQQHEEVTAELLKSLRVERILLRKKRKITGSKRIQFETSYAKLVAWLHPRLEPSYEIKVDEDISIESEVNKTFELGKDLIRTIISEADFPPDYLENVRFKIKELEALWGYFDIKRQYSSLKSNFYKELASLKKFLDVSQKLIESCEDIECLRTGKEAFIKHSETLDSIKRLSKEVALCPGALQDPSSSVKSDLYSFCDKWELIESGFEAKEIELIKRNKLLERQLKKSHATENRLGGGSGAISSHTNGNMKTDLGFETDPNKMDKLQKSLSSNLDDGSDHGNRLLPGLIEDLTALEKKLDNMNSMGSMLMTEARDESKAKILKII
ncbi:unnamed protein product [Lepeophtheirus salmonis]|uniref:(salmon louse) hypothetical protein n=1 Tax=Lepeophtheirus salmonis TaxID=72036 RepID=A0A7R8D4J8_LEPSM|nr:unnamed protein product [Lepeophtheirus salmonis]CAF3026781.1 unnamed protein product [Lepeophtheirus salmonis]